MYFFLTWHLLPDLLWQLRGLREHLVVLALGGGGAEAVVGGGGLLEGKHSRENTLQRSYVSESKMNRVRDVSSIICTECTRIVIRDTTVDVKIVECAFGR